MAKAPVSKWAESKRSGDYASAKAKADQASATAANHGNELRSSAESAKLHDRAASLHKEASKLATTSRDKKDHDRYALEHTRDKAAHEGYAVEPEKADHYSKLASDASARAGREEARGSSQKDEYHRIAADAHAKAANLQLEAGNKTKALDHAGRAQLHASASGDDKYVRDELGRFAGK